MKKLFLMLCFALAMFGLKAQEMTVAEADTLAQNAESVLKGTSVKNLKDFAELSKYHIDALVDLKRIENADGDAVVSIVVPIVCFLFFFAVIFIAIYYNSRDKKERYKLLEKSIDKGVDIPQNMLITTRKERDYFYYLKNGIIMACLALAFVIIGFIYKSFHGWGMFGAVLGSLGLAYFIIAFFDKKREKKNPSEKENN